MTEPKQLVEEIERSPPEPRGSEERFGGYGIMGLPFASGHVLALRRFPASSVGPGYTSVWHRTPDGRWTFYSNVQPLQSCNRYFGNAVERFVPAEIEIEWEGPRSISVRIPAAEFVWRSQLAPTAATRLMNAAGGLMPDALWRNGPALRAMGVLASVLLGLGRVRLKGTAPNGQQFIANPLQIWTIPTSTASLGAEQFGPVGPLQQQAFVGEFAIPQRGVFIIGRAFFEQFDPARHLAVTART